MPLRTSDSPHPATPARSRARALGLGLSALLMAGVALAGFSVPAAQAAPGDTTALAGTPGTPQEPTLIWSEDFEQGQGDTPTLVEDYVASDGVTYTADGYWLNHAQCNGVITNYRTGLPLVGGGAYGPATFPAGMCTVGDPSYSQLNVRRLADVLGQVGEGTVGGTKPTPANASNAATQNNHAVTAWTTQGQAAAGDRSMFASEAVLPIATPSNAHYYTTGVDVAEVSCEYASGNNNSKLDFVLELDGVDTKVNTAPIRACADGRVGYYTSPVPEDLNPSQATWGNGGPYVAAGHYYSDNALFLTPEQVTNLRIRMENQTLSGSGNDFAFDNITLYDATPSLDKAFGVPSIVQGDVTTLTFTVTNTADLAAKSGWSFTDTLPAGITVANDPGASTTCLDPTGAAGSQAAVTAAAGSGTIAVTGGIGANVASCTITVNVTSSTVGSYVNGPDNVTQEGLYPPGDAPLTVTPQVALSITKDAQIDSYTPGEAISYVVRVANAASTPETPISTATGARVTDTVPSSITGVTWTCSASAEGSCSPSGSGQTIDDTVTIPAGGYVEYTVSGTVADGSTGAIANTATVTPPTTILVPGAPGGDGPYPVTDPACQNGCSATATTPDSAIALVKTASATEVTAAGQEITYTFTVTNTGGSTLTDVQVSDEFTAGGAGTLGPIECTALANPDGDCAGASATLEPGQVATFEAVYTVAQADVDGTAVANTAVATGTPPDGPNVTSTDEHEITPVQTPGIDVVKTSDVSTYEAADAAIEYTFAVTNTGNVTLENVGVTDVFDASSGSAGPIECEALTNPAGACSGGSTTLAPGQTATFTMDFTTAQGDVDRGSLHNVATASGTPTGGTTPVTDVDDATVTGTQTPGIGLVKTVDPAAFAAAGDVLTYTFEVTNSGNVTLSGVSVADAFDVGGTGTITAIECRELTSPDAACAGATTDLAPGQSARFTADYTTVQADVDGGTLHNVATATGTPPSGTPVTGTDDATATSTATPGISVEKSADRESIAAAGDVVNYTFTVQNTGGVTLSGVTVADVFDLGGSGELSAIECQALTSPDAACAGAETTLAPGQIATFTASYTALEADVNVGGVDNTATATGTPPSGPAVSDTDDASVVATTSPSITIVKSSDRTAVERAGDRVVYSFTVTNAGNVTLSDVSVSDSFLSGGTGDFTAIECQVLTAPDGECSGTTTALEPGQSAVFEATYTVVAADLQATSIHNSATATGSTPGGEPLTSDPSAVIVQVPAGTPIDPSDPTLPTTGAELPFLVIGLALVLAVAGGATIVIRRRTA